MFLEVVWAHRNILGAKISHWTPTIQEIVDLRQFLSTVPEVYKWHGGELFSALKRQLKKAPTSPWPRYSFFFLPENFSFLSPLPKRFPSCFYLPKNTAKNFPPFGRNKFPSCFKPKTSKSPYKSFLAPNFLLFEETKRQRKKNYTRDWGTLSSI